MQRKLRNNGLCFTQMVDQIRRDSAMALLKQQNLCVTPIASLLGYSEIIAFSRAFQARVRAQSEPVAQCRGRLTRLFNWVRPVFTWDVTHLITECK